MVACLFLYHPKATAHIPKGVISTRFGYYSPFGHGLAQEIARFTQNDYSPALHAFSDMIRALL